MNLNIWAFPTVSKLCILQQFVPSVGYFRKILLPAQILLGTRILGSTIISRSGEEKGVLVDVENREDAENKKADDDIEKKDNEADVTNCDGMVLSNLDENCTVEDIKKILKESLNEADLETIPVHPAGSTRSKLIKDIMDNIGSIARKIDGKSFNGSLLHCRPHVPISPVKQNNAKVKQRKTIMLRRFQYLKRQTFPKK